MTANRLPAADHLLTTTEAANLLGMTARSFTVARSAGSLRIAPAGRQGPTKLYLRSQVLAVAEGRSQARQSAPCRIPGCTLTGRQGHGYLCTEHAALVAAGEPLESLRGRPSPVRPRSLTRRERVDSGIRAGADGCERWMRAVSGNGYGNCYDAGRYRQAHIVRFEIVMGRPVAENCELDHECEQKLCVRIGPGHVVEVTHKENMRRMAARAAARRTLQARLAAIATAPAPVWTLEQVRAVLALLDDEAALTALPEAA